MWIDAILNDKEALVKPEQAWSFPKFLKRSTSRHVPAKPFISTKFIAAATCQESQVRQASRAVNQPDCPDL